MYRSAAPRDPDDQPYVAFLDAYPHPAFVLPAFPALSKAAPSLHPVYANPAFRHLVLGTVLAADDAPGHAFLTSFVASQEVLSFGLWLIGTDPTTDLELRPQWFPPGAQNARLTITKTVMNAYIVCTTVLHTTIPQALDTAPAGRSPGLIPNFPDRDRSPSTPCQLFLPDGASSVAMLMETFDWASSPLGPREKWPQSLVSALGLCMSAAFPSAICWGPEKLLMYNEAYIDTAGTKHPQIFGQAGAVAWSELWEKIGPLMTDVYNGATIWKQNDLLFFNRLGPDRLPEENYYSFSYRPIPQEDGKIGGLLNDAFDTTKKVISDRRTNMLRDLIRSSIIVTSKTQFAASILQILSKPEYAYDVPFAGLYMCSVAKLEHADQLAPASATYTAATTIIEQAPKPTSCTLELAGTVGVATGHTAFPDTVELWLDNKTGSAPSSQFASALTSQLTSHTSSPMNGMTVNGSEKFARLSMHSPASTEYSTDTRGSQRRRRRADLPWPFEEAAQQRTPMLVPILNEAFVEGIDRRAWGDRPREAIVMPVGIDDDDTPRAMLILGLNTRRPYDENYQESMEFMRVTLGSALHAVLAREEDSIRAERLADLDAAKTSFFSNVSHELRTPLTLIGGPLDDCVAKLPEGSALRSSLRMASRNVQRLSRLVDSLMDFSKLAARRLEGAFRPVLLGPFVADLASMFRDPIEKSGMQYDVECDLSPDQPLCYIDPEFWEKIVFNLIGNAFKYTMSGTITIRVSFDATQATFSVQDTGIGIPAADMEKIFNRFHRVQCVSRSFEGTGIGLSLTKELVHLHGGELTVESHDDSHDDHGSTFAVSLPLGKDHLPPGSVHLEEEFAVGRRRYGQGIVNDAIMWSRTTDAGDHTPASDAGSLASDASGTGSGGSKLDPATMFFKKTDIVLIADDNSEMRHYMKTILAPYCTVVEASNGKEALELAIQKKPHVVLSDVMMPVMDGFALLGALQEHPATRLLPVILVTAKSGDDSRVEGLLSGADDYLAKPFRSAELVARVHLQMQLGKRRVFLETRFEERTKEVQQLLEQSPVAIFRTDVDGKIVYVNPRWFEMLSQPPGDVDNWEAAIYDEDLAAFKKFWYREHEDDSSEHIIEFRCTDGKWYQGQLAPTDDGGALGTLTDISNQRMFEAAQLEHAREREATARRKAEEAEDRRQEAEQRRRGQELLIDVTSHELRQPVSAILNCSGLVRTNMVALLEHIQGAKSGAGVVLTAEQLDSMREDVEALDAIYQCGLAQERIANDVLSLSRMQLDSLNIQAVDFELVTETQRIVSIFRNEAKMKEINLSVHFGKSLANLGVCVVRSDKSRYAQVITNLVSNAIKFTDSSPNRRDIRVDMEVSLLPPDDEDSAAYPRVARQNERLSNAKLASGTRLYIYVSVTDSGPGLQPDDLAVLFRRFQQGSLAAKSDVFGGSGLGLFVSRKLCDLMGGRIAVQSELGKGAVFSFFIESFAASVPASPNGSGQRSPPALSLSRVTSHGELPLPNFAQSPLRVLITEDNLINQRVLNRQLVKAGCTTVLANNGQQALDCLTSAGQPFDAVLMDIEMPVMDGIEAVRRIRQMEADGELRVRNRVYALTANAREGQVRLIKEAGMDAVLIKPYRIEDVIKAIRGVYSP